MRLRGRDGQDYDITFSPQPASYPDRAVYKLLHAMCGRSAAAIPACGSLAVCKVANGGCFQKQAANLRSVGSTSLFGHALSHALCHPVV